MKILFIRECEKPDNLIQKIILKINQIICKIKKKEYFWEIPINQKTIFNDKFIAKKLAKKLYKEDIQRVVISEGLKENKNIKLQLYDNNIDILDGRILFKYLITDVVDYIFEKGNKKIEQGEVSILINSVDDLAIKNIIEIAKRVKRLNIVTNHSEHLKNTENYLYNELGIMIACNNNKKTSLIKSDIIINIDFPEETLNSYRLGTRAIVINIEDKININIKKFNGININYFNIEIPQEYKMEFFRDEEVYESFILKISSYEIIRNMIIHDNVKIKWLIGNNGPISVMEYK